LLVQWLPGMVARRWQEFAIQDQTNIKVVVRDYLHDHFDVEYDYVNHDRPGRTTSNIGTMNDGAWHFLSVVWSGVAHTLQVCSTAESVERTCTKLILDV